MKKNVILQGDTIEVMKGLPSNSVDLIFADPPYWMRTNGVLKRVEGTDFDGVNDEWDQFTNLSAYESFSRSWLTECKRILKPNGSIWVIGGMQCIYTIGGIMQELGFWIINDVIWHKTNPTPNFQGTRLNNSHETLIWATKTEKSKYTFHYKTAKELNVDTVSENDFKNGVRKQLGSVWRFSVAMGSERIKDDEGNKLHSTQKPEGLLYRIIAISSNLGDLVLDPFGGTMTTGAMARRMGRDYIMIERDSKYCEYGERRLSSELEVIGAIERAEYDEKPLKATMEAMILSGNFIEGELFYLNRSEITGVLQNDGKLNINGEIIDMHTGAAKASNKKANRVNGFDFWYVKRNGIFVSIADIREQYREKIKEQSNVKL